MYKPQTRHLIIKVIKNFTEHQHSMGNERNEN